MEVLINARELYLTTKAIINSKEGFERLQEDIMFDINLSANAGEFKIEYTRPEKFKAVWGGQKSNIVKWLLCQNYTVEFVDLDSTITISWYFKN